MATFINPYLERLYKKEPGILRNVRIKTYSNLDKKHYVLQIKDKEEEHTAYDNMATPEYLDLHCDILEDDIKDVETFKKITELN